MAETAGGVGGWAGGEGGEGGWVGGGGGWSIGKCFNVFFASGAASPAFALVSLTLDFSGLPICKPHAPHRNLGILA